ncbi:MAG: nucleoside-diphosphate kinase [Candidatus Aureabacteria bacterium]|nr:nucleoside-diphosphate kinase [Candidatus Auribacterota bacterium]
MGEELAFAIINPYTIRKSRTGGIIGRLLSRSDVELVAARMYAPSNELVNDYLETIRVDKSEPNWQVRELIKQYIQENYAPSRDGHRRRVMFLLFRGEDAIHQLTEHVVGHITRASLSGETIRDTYGDYIRDVKGGVSYFEPAVLIIPAAAEAEPALRVWARHAKRDGGLLEKVIPWPAGQKCEETTVLIKPDIFSARSIRAGNVIDIFSKADLYIIGVKVLRMSVAQAEEFYGPVKKTLVKRLKESVTSRATLALEREFGFPIPAETAAELGDTLNRLAAEDQFNQIVEFMTGRNLASLTEAERNAPGLVRCLALVYQGVDAVNKIRSIVGATDPGKAGAATVRKEFGRDIMVNAAHASDSLENAQREMRIIDFEEDDVGPLITESLNRGK